MKTLKKQQKKKICIMRLYPTLYINTQLKCFNAADIVPLHVCMFFILVSNDCKITISKQQLNNAVDLSLLLLGVTTVGHVPHIDLKYVNMTEVLPDTTSLGRDFSL